MVQRVFISYTHDSEEHEARMWDLSEWLREQGVKCHIDLDEQSPADGWPLWCSDQIEKADFVLVVCTKAYRYRYRGKGTAGKGHGGNWEGLLIRQSLYDARGKNRRFIPLVVSSADTRYIPKELRGPTHYDLSKPSGRENLFRLITAQPDRRPSEVAPQVRRMPSLAKKSSTSDRATVPHSKRPVIDRREVLKTDEVADAGKFTFYPVILAGGRGTRFWPLSRKLMPKQLLPLNSGMSIIQETVERLLPLAKAKQFWVITNKDLREPIQRQLKNLEKKQILAEPVGRNTAPAIGLAAFLLARLDPNAVIGMFPSDHVIVGERRFREDIKRAVQIAGSGETIVVIGIPPTRAETGYGYIEVGDSSQKGVLQVRRFTEKPLPEVAERFVKTGNFFWNSGMFIWSARTLAKALQDHTPNMAPLLEKIAGSYGSPRFTKTFARLYPGCENISVDYAVLEPRSRKGEGASGIYCIPATFGWNDLGSWAALYDHLSAGKGSDENVMISQQSFTLNARGNLIHSPEKFVAALGVSNLVVVETDDALLITTREHAQDVGKVVKHLDEKKLKRLV